MSLYPKRWLVFGAVAIPLSFVVVGCDEKKQEPARSAVSEVKSSDVAAEARDALRRCDEFASDPGDPGRWARGISDADMAPGAAIDACFSAVKLNPSSPRAHFELGRSYWIAHRDTNAWDEFIASRDYGPSFKYIGDAYFYGRGLPSGEVRNARTALIWYQKAADVGYEGANKSIDITKTVIAQNTFDENKFQNGRYMAALYNDTIKDIDMPISLATYAKAVVDQLESQNVLMIDSSCAPLATYVGSVTLDFVRYALYLRMLNGGKDLENGMKSYLTNDIVEDQGEKDALILINAYGCRGPVTKQIVDHIVLNYSEVNHVIDSSSQSNENQDQLKTEIAPQQSVPPSPLRMPPPSQETRDVPATAPPPAPGY